MKWFGQSWDAPVCDPDHHIATPVGWGCSGCGKHLRATDSGVMVPDIENCSPKTIGLPPHTSLRHVNAWHRRCFAIAATPRYRAYWNPLRLVGAGDESQIFRCADYRTKSEFADLFVEEWFMPFLAMPSRKALVELNKIGFYIADEYLDVFVAEFTALRARRSLDE